MKKALLFSLLFGIGINTSAMAHNIKLDQPLPSITVTNKGQLILNKGEIDYKPWKSTELVGKARILQHIAGRRDVKAKNQSLMEAIKAAHFNEKEYQTTNIVNADDAIFGTGFIVRSGVSKAKKANARSQIVLDNNGVVKKAWNLKAKESLIVVLDKKGKVKFVHEGKLTDSQIHHIINLIPQLEK